VARQASDYIKRAQYETVVLLHESQQWGDSVKELCGNACLKNGIAFELLDIKAEGSKNILTHLEMILRKNLSG
jgi:hypothetical protein